MFATFHSHLICHNGSFNLFFIDCPVHSRGWAAGHFRDLLVGQALFPERSDYLTPLQIRLAAGIDPGLLRDGYALGLASFPGLTAAAGVLHGRF